jgi:hypothetical protein
MRALQTICNKIKIYIRNPNYFMLKFSKYKAGKIKDGKGRRCKSQRPVLFDT